MKSSPQTRVASNVLRKPFWLKVNLPSGETVSHVAKIKATNSLVTVCEEAKCPNRHECWSGGTATFMLMGDTCTRACSFCSVSSGKPNGWLDYDEPFKLASAVTTLGLKYVVITSVARDDLADGGADHIVSCIQAIKEANPEILVEVLIPDLQGDIAALRKVVESPVEVIAHNIETVERLTQKVRDPRAMYSQSLQVLENIKRMDPSKYTKTSIMVGVGETWDDLSETFLDLQQINVDFLTIGQYLRPTKKQMPVEKYIHPDVFAQMREEALKHGFKYVASGPLVRSSYKAGELFLENLNRSSN